MWLNLELQEHFRYVALESNLLLPKPQQNSKERVYQIGAGQKRVVQGFSVELCRTVKYDTYFLFYSMVHAVMRDVPTWFVDVVDRNTFAEIVFDHLIHKSDVLLFVVIVSFHFSLQIFKALLSHGQVTFKSNNRLLAGNGYFVVTIREMLAVSSCIQKLLVFTREGASRLRH